MEVLLDVDGEVVGYADADTPPTDICDNPFDGLWSEMEVGFTARNGPRAM